MTVSLPYIQTYAQETVFGGMKLVRKPQQKLASQPCELMQTLSLLSEGFCNHSLAKIRFIRGSMGWVCDLANLGLHNEF